MGACYLLEFESGKVYIGITTKTAEERFASHCYEASRGLRRPFYTALRKYGPESVTVHTLAESEDWAELCQWERHFIALFGSQDRVLGYNCTRGGDGVVNPSDEAREKISVATTGQLHRQWADPAYRSTISAARAEAWTNPEFRKHATTRARNKKRRAMEAVAASIDDYGEHAGAGIAPPVDYEDRVRVATQASPLGYGQLATLSGVGVASVFHFATRQRGLRPATLHRLAVALGVAE